jgi:hypothetical protein
MYVVLDSEETTNKWQSEKKIPSFSTSKRSTIKHIINYKFIMRWRKHSRSIDYEHKITLFLPFFFLC